MYKWCGPAALAFSLFLLWIIYLANVGGQCVLFDVALAVPHGDKIGHVLLFGLLAFLANFGLRLRTLRVGGIGVYTGTAAVSLFVVVEELSQGFFPTRSMDVNDLLADAVGIVLFTVLTHVVSKRHVLKGPVPRVVGDAVSHV